MKQECLPLGGGIRAEVIVKRYDGLSIAANSQSSVIQTLPKGIYVVSSLNWNYLESNRWLHTYINGLRNNSGNCPLYQSSGGGCFLLTCPNATNDFTLYEPFGTAVNNLSIEFQFCKVSDL